MHVKSPHKKLPKDEIKCILCTISLLEEEREPQFRKRWSRQAKRVE